MTEPDPDTLVDCRHLTFGYGDREVGAGQRWVSVVTLDQRRDS